MQLNEREFRGLLDRVAAEVSREVDVEAKVPSVVFSQRWVGEGRFSGVRWVDHRIVVSSRVGELLRFVAYREGFRCLIPSSLWLVEEVHDLAWLHGYLAAERELKLSRQLEGRARRKQLSALLDWWSRCSESRVSRLGGFYNPPRDLLCLGELYGRKAAVQVLKDLWWLHEAGIQGSFDLYFRVLWHHLHRGELSEGEVKVLRALLYGVGCSRIAEAYGRSKSWASTMTRRLRDKGVIAGLEATDLTALGYSMAIAVIKGYSTNEEASLSQDAYRVFKPITEPDTAIAVFLADRSMLGKLRRRLEELRDSRELRELVFMYVARSWANIASREPSSPWEAASSIARLLQLPMSLEPAYRSREVKIDEFTQKIVEELAYTGRVSASKLRKKAGGGYSTFSRRLYEMRSKSIVTRRSMLTGVALGDPYFIAIEYPPREAPKAARAVLSACSGTLHEVEGDLTGIAGVIYLKPSQYPTMTAALSLIFNRKLRAIWLLEEAAGGALKLTRAIKKERGYPPEADSEEEQEEMEASA